MKKGIILFTLLFGTLYAVAQPHPVKKKRKDDFSVTVKDSEKHKIDWEGMKQYFRDKKPADSIQISVRLTDQDYKGLKSESEYTLWGKYEDFDKIVDNLKKIVNIN